MTDVYVPPHARIAVCNVGYAVLFNGSAYYFDPVELPPPPANGVRAKDGHATLFFPNRAALDKALESTGCTVTFTRWAGHICWVTARNEEGREHGWHPVLSRYNWTTMVPGEYQVVYGSPEHEVVKARVVVSDANIRASVQVSGPSGIFVTSYCVDVEDYNAVAARRPSATFTLEEIMQPPESLVAPKLVN